jgi:uncharacterized membrane protein
MEHVALFLHLLGVLVFAGGVGAAGIGFEAARRRPAAREVAVLLGVARVGAILVGGGGALLLAAGLWLVSLEEEVGFGTGWVDAALALFALAMVLGGLSGQRPKRARLLAERLAEADAAPTAELRALLDDRRSRLVNYASAAIVLAILALMVFKP